MTRKMILVPIAACLCIGMLLLAIASLAGTEHADEKHSEAHIVRSSIRNGLCQQKEVWFSPPSGRILFLCQLESDQTLWAGWPIFITANNGVELIQPHEATAFVASERYWRRTIEADGYLPAVMFPRVLDHATDTLGIQTP